MKQTVNNHKNTTSWIFVVELTIKPRKCPFHAPFSLAIHQYITNSPINNSTSSLSTSIVRDYSMCPEISSFLLKKKEKLFPSTLSIVCSYYIFILVRRDNEMLNHDRMLRRIEQWRSGFKWHIEKNQRDTKTGWCRQQWVRMKSGFFISTNKHIMAFKYLIFN